MAFLLIMQALAIMASGFVIVMLVLIARKQRQVNNNLLDTNRFQGEQITDLYVQVADLRRLLQKVRE